jgi:toxin ParE1/3/4
VKLRYTLPALADLSSILDYIAAVSPHGAKRVQKRIQDVIDLLSTHPDIGIRTDDPAIRRLPTPPYPFLVFYEVTEKRSSSTRSVTPLAILPGCQGPRSRLKPRRTSP